MTENVRVLSDGNRLVVVIENADNEMIEKVTEVFGVALEKITGLDKPPVNNSSDIKIPESKPSENKNTESDEGMYVFPPSSKNHHGQTVLEVLQQDDIEYLHYILCKTNYKKKNEIWRDLNRYATIVADIIEENSKKWEKLSDNLFCICDIFDKEPGVKPVTPSILANIEANDLVDATLDEKTAPYILESMIAYIRAKGENNG